MKNECSLELYLYGQWRVVGSLLLTGKVEAGWEAATYTGYDVEHALEHQGRRDAAAFSWTLPVGLEPHRSETWPAFLMDLLPQGYGRKELLRQLSLSENAGQSADWRLLLAGAGNPIGNLRVRQAREWLDARSPESSQGFTFQAVAERGEAFTEYLAEQGLFVAGSSGIQGEWPKILLTEDAQGLLHLDHALPDSEAKRHWLVKFARGDNLALNTILKLEAPYMGIAQGLGLRVHGPLNYAGKALFIPRFDRDVSAAGVVRHAQESLYSICRRAGFGASLSHNEACRVLGMSVTDKQNEIIEYLKRDVANVLLGNKDNHGRNTAVQRREDGAVLLTPLFDFTPMFLHPDGIARRMRWDAQDGGHPEWAAVAEQAAQAAQLDAAPLRAALREFAVRVKQIPEMMQTLRFPPEIVERLLPGIDAVAVKLERC